MKKSAIIVLAVIAALVILSVAKDFVIKASIQKGMEIVTGLHLRMQGFKAGIINTTVDIRNLKLLNPPGYTDKTMLDMPEIYVKYNLPAIIRGKIHLPEVRINLKEFVVVKNEKGQLNLNSLKVVQAQKEAVSPQEKKKMPPMQIDSLALKIGKVVYKDYSRGTPPSVNEFEINLDEKYSNITDPYSVVSLIVVKSMMNTTIARLSGFDLRGLQGTIGKTLGTAQKMAGHAVTQAADAAKKTGEAARQAKDITKKAVEIVGDVLKNPFGGE